MKPDTLPSATELSSSPGQFLADAFARFNEASSRLEEHHAELQGEIDSLKEQLREKQREIERAARLATLGETAAAIAHEVRNPLGAIKLFASLLRQDVAHNPGSLKLVDQIDSGIMSIEHVVSNILHFTKDKPELFTPVNLHALLKEQLALLEPLHKDRATITISTSGTPYISGDEHSLRRAVYNLLLNALQATKYTGAIEVMCEQLSDVEILLVVRDNGPGIPPSVMPKLFEPFVTSRNEGTGLGLAIVKRIIEQHGGTIEAHNDNGAVFMIRFAI
ncbi:MAG: sensor histidine kinase [Proteobacteria bacterium]|nr:sensor histidine kinase [Pseudomonadota bacterium]